MSDDTNKDEIPDLLAFDPDGPGKSLEELVEEGAITAKQFRSMLFLMQGGHGFSTSLKDALYIQKKIKELNAQIVQEEAKGKVQ